MSAENPKTKMRYVKWQVISLMSLMITVLAIYFYVYRHVSIENSILGWLAAIALASSSIWYSYSRIERLQAQLDQKIGTLEKQSQREAALAQLSGGFTATYNETQICDELIERLQSVQGYDFVAVFIVDQVSGNRILHTEALKEELNSSPVLRPGEGLSERPLLDGKLHYSPDITKEPAHIPGLSHGSEIDVPIEFDGVVLGVIVVESYEYDAFEFL